VPAKQCVTKEQNESKDQHLRRKEAKHTGGDSKPGAFADVARDLSELNAGQLHFLSREVNTVFGYVAEQLAYAAIICRQLRCLTGV
jgi:hypothetical protein